MSRCKGSRAGHTRAGVGHQELNKANGQAKKAEHDLGQGQSKDFMGERSTGKSCSSIYCIMLKSKVFLQYITVNDKANTLCLQEPDASLACDTWDCPNHMRK